MIQKVVQRTLSIPDDKIAEIKAEIAYKHEPGSWFDGYTEAAFQRKWGMSTYEAEQLVGRPVTTTKWKNPE